MTTGGWGGSGGPGPFESLRLIDDTISRNGQTPELLEARLRCLCEMGRFEMATELAHTIANTYPGRGEAPLYLEWLEAALAPPPVGPTSPRERSYTTELPRSVLLRMQQAVHHFHYRGRQLIKNPFDLALYSLLFERVRPLTVVEIGSKSGGSALWFADLLQRLGIPGHIHSFDIFPVTDFQVSGVTFRYGDGRHLAEVAGARFMEACDRPLLVIEDADHTYETTSAVLDFCHQWLRPGEYVVIEDGNLSDLYPEAYPDCSSGPHRAVREFLEHHDSEYDIDADLCDFLES